MQLTRILLYTVLCSLSYVLIDSEALDPDALQIMLALVFAAGIVFEFRVAREPFFVLPPSVFAVYCFFNNILGGISYFSFDQKVFAQFYVKDVSVIWGTWYTVVAVNVLWVAFYSVKDFQVPLVKRVQIKDVSFALILGLTAVAVGTFLFAISIGSYGYMGNDPDLDAYIKFGVRLGLLAIVLLVIYRGDTPQSRPALIVLLAINVVMGLAWGSKSTALTPIALVIICMYFKRQRISALYWGAAVMTLMVAYFVVEPFRVYYEAMQHNVDLSSPAKLMDVYSKSQDFSSGVETDYTGALLARSNYVVPLAKAIEFADGNNYYRSEEWGDLALSPLYAVVPRFLWQSKPLADFGSWASVNIFGMSATTSTGITPQGYAYLVARLTGVLVFFFMFGIIQRLLFNMLYLNASLIPFYIILLYLEVGYPSVVPWTYVSGTIKWLLLFSPLVAILAIMGQRKPIIRYSRA